MEKSIILTMELDNSMQDLSKLTKEELRQERARLEDEIEKRDSGYGVSTVPQDELDDIRSLIEKAGDALNELRANPETKVQAKVDVMFHIEAQSHKCLVFADIVQSEALEEHLASVLKAKPSIKRLIKQIEDRVFEANKLIKTVALKYDVEELNIWWNVDPEGEFHEW